MAEQWLSIVEYARTFAVSDMTIRRRIKNGKLQAVLREGKYYIPLGADAMLDVSDNLEPETPSRVIQRPIEKKISQGESLADESASSLRPGASSRTLPSNISSLMQKQESSLVDSQALLQFCEHSVTRINSIERHLQENFHLKIQNLESQLRLKDSVIVQLKQQVEDMQMLVKLMEMNQIKT